MNFAIFLTPKALLLTLGTVAVVGAVAYVAVKSNRRLRMENSLLRSRHMLLVNKYREQLRTKRSMTLQIDDLCAENERLAEAH
jgi:hypothetical protein